MIHPNIIRRRNKGSRLLAGALALTPFRPLRVTGHSMEPTLRDGEKPVLLAGRYASPKDDYYGMAAFFGRVGRNGCVPSITLQP